MNNKKPLGLPVGSVRAILAIVVVIGAIAYWIIYKDMPTEFLGIVGIVIGYYFGERTAEVHNANSIANTVETEANSVDNATQAETETSSKEESGTASTEENIGEDTR